MGHEISERTLGKLLKAQGFRLQANHKTREGSQHPDRDAQFEHINETVKMALVEGQPVISIDCKHKELVGEYKNGGREWEPSGKPVQVQGHDFPTGVPKAVPYGVYDIGLKVYARLDPTIYTTGTKVTKDQIAAVNITGHDWHPEWNYRITPAGQSS